MTHFSHSTYIVPAVELVLWNPDPGANIRNPDFFRVYLHMYQNSKVMNLIFKILFFEQFLEQLLFPNNKVCSVSEHFVSGAIIAGSVV